MNTLDLVIGWTLFFVMSIEVENCMSHCFVGLPSPKPPNLVGKANTSRSMSLGASLPVIVGFV